VEVGLRVVLRNGSSGEILAISNMQLKMDNDFPPGLEIEQIRAHEPGSMNHEQKGIDNKQLTIAPTF
jgi:hypothetical protein